jgi:hypothetical protein
MISLNTEKTMDELFDKLIIMLSRKFAIASEQISMGSKLNSELGIDYDYMLDLADKCE